MAARENSVHSTEDVVAGFRDPLEVLNHSTKCEMAWKLCTLTLCPIPAPKPLGMDCSWCLTFRLGPFRQSLCIHVTITVHSSRKPSLQLLPSWLMTACPSSPPGPSLTFFLLQACILPTGPPTPSSCPCPYVLASHGHL